MIVGNDVVDLTAPRAADRHLDVRFVSRVFTDMERDAILASGDPAIALWLGWAAKEAAYKAVSKSLGEPPVFAHRRFEVMWKSGGGAEGLVRWEGFEIPVRASGGTDVGYVHVLARMSSAHPEAPATASVERLDRNEAPWAGPLERLLEQLTDRERASVHRRPSAAVRIGARADIARHLGIEVERVQIVCPPGPFGRRAPSVLVDGAGANVDVSLSHDGPWIAWALCRR